MRKPHATVAPDLGPTPERLRHANDNYTSVAGAVRMADTEIDRLFAANELHPQPATNEQLRDAADQYLRDFTDGGMDALQATDYSKPLIGGSSGGGGKSAARERKTTAWWGAKKALGNLARVVDPVVLGGQRLAAVAAGLGLAYRLAQRSLREGLMVLAKRYSRGGAT